MLLFASGHVELGRCKYEVETGFEEVVWHGSAVSVDVEGPI